MQGQRICKRCLLKDIAPQYYLEHMKTIIERLEDEVKSEESLYLERLSKCEECDKLSEGVCRICGCFVEYRAAIRLRSCPSSPARW